MASEISNRLKHPENYKNGIEKSEIRKAAKANEKTYVGYRPLMHQLTVHRALDKAYRSGKVYVVKARRQVGKSIMVEQELLRFAITYSRTTSACISPTLAQSRKVFTDILDCISDSGVVMKKNETLLEIVLINGSKIFFKSAEQRDSLRGFTISGILCIDECAFISDEIFQLVLPWTNVHRAPILMTSTPKFKEGFFWDYWNRGLDRRNGSVKAFDFNNFDTSALLPPEKMEEYRHTLPRNQFLTEYMGEFLDGDGVVFTDFKSLQKPYTEKPTGLYVGIDWGTGNGEDSTSLSVIDEKGRQVYTMNFNDKNTTQQIDTIGAYLESIRGVLKYVRPELNSIGTPMTELLKQKCPWAKIEGAVTTNTSKADMVSSLQVAFEQKQITLLPDEEQARELSIYEADYNYKTKNITYNAPKGHHDDRVIALMLSWSAYKEGNKKGIYHLR